MMRDRHMLRGFVRRPGVTVIVVLVMIVSSLALAYMIGRSQVATIRLQSNSDLDMLARQAAMTGFANGLRSMYEANWAGVGATISTTLNSQQSFTVTYTTGDALLTATDPNWPYRVTILVVGTAVDLSHPVSATHRIQAVVQLLPRQLAAEPTNWSTMLQYTVYQYAANTFDLQLPCRIAGNVLIQGTLRLADDYPPSNDGQNQYLSDINTMQALGYGDNRPLTGNVSLPYGSTASGTLSDLNLLGVSTTNVSPAPATNWAYPGEIVSYQLYPGGQVYTVPLAPSSLQNTTLAAAPRTNPLGIYYNSGTVTIGNNVTLTGTLQAGGDVVISGTNVVLQPVVLPALQGSTQGVQLPTVIVQNNFKVSSLASATVSGMIACWSSFDVLPGSQSTSLAVQGRLICGSCVFDDRSEWLLSGSQWSSTWTGFNNQSWPSWIWFYPQWLQQKKGLSYIPSLTIVPETTPVTYQWKTATNQVYVPNASDPGLRWTVVRWTDNVASH
jgi:hypothetical protein